MNNSFVEILLSAAISNGSIDKINNQIKQIQKDIKDIDINFNVSGDNGNNKVFSNMEKQINDLQSKIKQLEGTLSSVGKNTSSKNNPFESLSDGANSSLKNIYELQEYIAKFNGTLKIVDDSSTGKVKEVVTTIQNELGKLEKKIYRPVIDIKIDDIGTQGLLESTKITNIKDFDQYAKKLDDAQRQLNELGRKGNLTADNFKVLKKEINNALTTSDIDNFLVKMKELEQASSHSNKWTNAQENIRNQAEQSIQKLEKMRTTISTLGGDTSQIDKLVKDMREFANINISKDTDIKKANAGFANLSKEINQLKNDTSSYSTLMKSLESTLDSAQHKGLLSSEALHKVRVEIMAINASDMNLDEKLHKVRIEAEKLTNNLSQAKRDKDIELNTNRARNELDKLNASLTKTINSYKRTVNMEEANSIKSSLTSMSNMPVFTDLGQIQKYRAELDGINTRIKQLNADATVGARNSMSVIESFKVAMER